MIKRFESPATARSRCAAHSRGVGPLRLSPASGIVAELLSGLLSTQRLRPPGARCLAILRALGRLMYLWPPQGGMSAPVWVVLGFDSCAHAVKGPGWGLEHQRDQPEMSESRVSVRTVMDNITPTFATGG